MKIQINRYWHSSVMRSRLSPLYVATMLSLFTGCAPTSNINSPNEEKSTETSTQDLDAITEIATHNNYTTVTKNASQSTNQSAIKKEVNLAELTARGGHLLEGKTITEIDIVGLSDEVQLNNARTFLTLEKIINEPIERVEYTAYLINHGREEIARALQPFGYYNAKVVAKSELDGDMLLITYTVELNKPVLLHEINVSLNGEAQNDEAFTKLIRENPLKIGAQLDHATYENYKAQFDKLASARGYFEAKFIRNVIYVDPQTQEAVVTLAFDSGPRYHYGEVEFSDVPLENDLLDRFVGFTQGAHYLSRDVALLQQDLQGSGYFQQVLIGNKPNPVTKTVPIEAKLTMNKNKRYILGVGYSTDEGVRAKFNFDWRWVNRRGHTFTSDTFVSEKKYSFDTIYRIPADNPTTDYYYFRAGASHEEDGYKTTRLFTEGGYNFVKEHWSHRYGLVSAWENFSIGKDSAKTLLTYPQAKIIYSSNTNRINPKSGYQVGLSARGGVKDVLSDVSFAQMELQLRSLYTINDQNKVTARADFGMTWSDDFNRLPPNLRYFAGGDRSIRGYGYRQIGGRDSVGNNIGGKYLATAGLEYQYFFKPQWAAAVFVDAGDAFTDTFSTKVGAGVGVRWNSPVGPISVDVAHGFNEPNNDKVRLHINVGTELDL